MPRMTHLLNFYGQTKRLLFLPPPFECSLQMARYLEVSYRIPDLPVLNSYAFTGTSTFSVAKTLDDLVVRYTLDGSLPSQTSMQLNNGILIDKTMHLRMAAFAKNGTRGDVYDVYLNKQDPVMPEKPTLPANGLIAKWYKKSFDSTTLISGMADAHFKVATVSVPKEAEVARFSLQYGAILMFL